MTRGAGHHKDWGGGARPSGTAVAGIHAMAILAPLFAFIGRQVGRIVQMAFGWATIMLFGRVPQDRQILLAAGGQNPVLGKEVEPPQRPVHPHRERAGDQRRGLGVDPDRGFGAAVGGS